MVVLTTSSANLLMRLLSIIGIFLMELNNDLYKGVLCMRSYPDPPWYVFLWMLIPPFFVFLCAVVPLIIEFTVMSLFLTLLRMVASIVMTLLILMIVLLPGEKAMVDLPAIDPTTKPYLHRFRSVIVVPMLGVWIPLWIYYFVFRAGTYLPIEVLGLMMVVHVAGWIGYVIYRRTKPKRQQARWRFDRYRAKRRERRVKKMSGE